MKKVLKVLLVALMLMTVCACSGGQTEPEEPGEKQRYVGICWLDTQIEFYNWAANTIKDAAEKAGWKAEISCFDFDVNKQIEQLENFATMGVTDIISIAVDADAIVDVCKRLREQGINLNFFAMAPNDIDAYDSVTVADQYEIGVAMAENAVDWVNEKYPDAADGSIPAVMISLPTDPDNMLRDDGVRDTLAKCPKIKLVKEYELDGQESVKVQEAVDTMMLEYPETQLVVCHFASFAIAADERLLTYPELDRENFGIFSGDIDTMIGERMLKTLTGEGLIRATGTYDPDGVYKQFDVCAGKYDDKLNDKKQYVYEITKFNLDDIKEYMRQNGYTVD